MDTDPPGRPASRALLFGAVVVVALVVVGLVGLMGNSGGTDDATVFDPDSLESGSLTDIPDALDALPPAELAVFGDDAAVVQITDLLGNEPLIVNFWATWCAPCVAEMPDLQEVAEAGEGMVQLIGINTQDSPQNALPFAEELGITYRNLSDPLGDYFTANNSFGMPTTLFVDPDGGIRWRQTGPMTLQQIVDLTAEHLGVTVPL